MEFCDVTLDRYKGEYKYRIYKYKNRMGNIFFFYSSDSGDEN